MSIRLLIVDDHPIVLRGLQQLFAPLDDFIVVACCADAGEALEVARERRPDVMLTDLRMPKLSGLQLLAAVKRDVPTCRTVLLTASISQAETVDALRLGVSGLVLKESTPEQLIACLRKVHRGEQSIDPDTIAHALTDVAAREHVRGELSRTLTGRELEIVKMVAQGLRNRAIGQQLSITESTVKVHLHNIYEKLGVQGRMELVLLAQQKGLV